MIQTQTQTHGKCMGGTDHLYDEIYWFCWVETRFVVRKMHSYNWQSIFTIFFLFFFFIFAVNKITYRQWVVYVVWSSSGELKRRVPAALYEYIWHTGISIPHFISPKWNRNGLENARIDLDYAMFRYPEWNHRESSMSPMKRINARR